MRLARACALLSLAVGAPVAAAPRSKPATTPLSPSEKAVATKYAAAMKRGRAATDKQDYAGAAAAFGDALALRAGDAQALAERGYAHLLAGDLDAAEHDLRAAQPHAAGASLAGMIWFNLGLVAEKRGDADAAKRAFAESNRLHPTKAAAAELAGATCTAAIATARDAGATYKTWVDLDVALETALAGPAGPTTRPSSEADAKARLCDDGCADRGPWIVAAKDDVGDASYAIVFAVGGGLVAHAGLAEKMAGRCETSDAIALVDDPAFVHVAVVREPNDMVEVDTSGGDVKPCGAHPDRCNEACFYDDKTDLDVYFERATGAQVAAVTRPETPRAGAELKLDEDFTQKVTLARTADGVALSGGGCDLRAPLRTP